MYPRGLPVGRCWSAVALAMINYLVMAYIDLFNPQLLDSEADPNCRLPLTATNKQLSYVSVFEVNTAVLLVISLVGLGGHRCPYCNCARHNQCPWHFSGHRRRHANAFRTILFRPCWRRQLMKPFALMSLQSSRLFMLMGEFIAKSGTVTDVYRGINRLLHKIPGRLAIATVIGNALFSFVTGVSIASAAAFSQHRLSGNETPWLP